MKTLSEFVAWLDSMTTSELLKEFPGQFHTLDARESSSECVKKMLANDAILWKKVKEYNKEIIRLDSSTKNDESVIAHVSGSVCHHEFVSREYSNQPYGTCLNCGQTVFGQTDR